VRGTQLLACLQTTESLRLILYPFPLQSARTWVRWPREGFAADGTPHHLQDCCNEAFRNHSGCLSTRHSIHLERTISSTLLGVYQDMVSRQGGAHEVEGAVAPG
jgi:hypothetical protein